MSTYSWYAKNTYLSLNIKFNLDFLSAHYTPWVLHTFNVTLVLILMFFLICNINMALIIFSLLFREKVPYWTLCVRFTICRIHLVFIIICHVKLVYAIKLYPLITRNSRVNIIAYCQLHTSVFYVFVFLQ